MNEKKMPQVLPHYSGLEAVFCAAKTPSKEKPRVDPIEVYFL